jgi:hypothetical protein
VRDVKEFCEKKAEDTGISSKIDAVKEDFEDAACEPG